MKKLKVQPVFNPQPKTKPLRDKDYLRWIKSLPCAVCGVKGVDPHHVTGLHSGMGTKTGDDNTIPLCRSHHQELHNDPVIWGAIHGNQLKHLETIKQLAKKEYK